MCHIICRRASIPIRLTLNSNAARLEQDHPLFSQTLYSDGKIGIDSPSRKKTKNEVTLIFSPDIVLNWIDSPSWFARTFSVYSSCIIINSKCPSVDSKSRGRSVHNCSAWLVAGSLALHLPPHLLSVTRSLCSNKSVLPDSD